MPRARARGTHDVDEETRVLQLRRLLKLLLHRRRGLRVLSQLRRERDRPRQPRDLRRGHRLLHYYDAPRLARARDLLAQTPHRALRARDCPQHRVLCRGHDQPPLLREPGRVHAHVAQRHLPSGDARHAVVRPRCDPVDDDLRERALAVTRTVTATPLRTAQDSHCCSSHWMQYSRAMWRWQFWGQRTLHPPPPRRRRRRGHTPCSAADSARPP